MSILWSTTFVALLCMTLAIQITSSQCAEAILGRGSPERTYNSYDPEEWKSHVEEQFARSGLQSTLRRISTDIVATALRRNVIAETKRLEPPVRKAVIYQR